jgi:dipeptidase D
MVCEKNSDVCFDFTKDAIKLKRDKDWICADGTTLGADDGIGVAIMLSILDDKTLLCGPLECLFTISEETGLVGASNMDKNLLSGNMMINIDSDNDKQFTIGSAAGEKSIYKIKISKKNATKKIPIEISVGGLLGGHSGIDISKNRANAIKILAIVLRKIFISCGAELVNIDGGDKSNAIPRCASCLILANNEDMKRIQQILITFNEKYKKEYQKTDKNININLKRIATHEGNFVLTKTSSDSIVSIINSLPHGIIEMHESLDIVETSTNLATIKINNDFFEIIEATRSFDELKLKKVLLSIDNIAKEQSFETNHYSYYPSWKPNLDSVLLMHMKKIYADMFNENPIIEAVHAGLECGIFKSKYPNLDIVSIGSTIQSLHSPSEKVNIKSVEKTYNFLLECLKEI